MSEGGRLRLVHRRLQRVEAGDAVADVVEEAVDLEVDGDADGVGEAMRVRAAMALDADALQAEEDGAVVAPRIESLAQLAQRSRRQPIADARRQRILEGRAQVLGVEPRRALCALDPHVAGEPAPHPHSPLPRPPPLPPPETPQPNSPSAPA